MVNFLLNTDAVEIKNVLVSMQLNKQCSQAGKVLPKRFYILSHNPNSPSPVKLPSRGNGAQYSKSFAVEGKLEMFPVSTVMEEKLHSQYLQQRQSMSPHPQCSQAFPTNWPLQSQTGQMFAHNSNSFREGKKTGQVKTWTSSSNQTLELNTFICCSPTCHFYVLKHFQFYNTKDFYFPTDQKIALTLPWLIE